MAYVREDMVLVTIDGDPIPWGKADGGAVVSSPGKGRVIESLTLERIRRDDGVHALAGLTKRVGDRATVTLAHLDPNGDQTGQGLVYEGTLVAVVPADYDANNNGAAMDRVVLRPTRLYALGEERYTCGVG